MALFSADALKVIGIKQVTKAIKEKKAIHLYVARDADSRITAPIVQAGKADSVKITYVDTMKELGEKAEIDVGASVVATVKE